MRSCIALALLLALCLALAIPSAVEAEPRSPDHRGGDLLSSLWSLLPWWSAASVQKAGMGSQSSAPATDAGMGIDPLGDHQESDPTTEEGMTIDPLG